MSNFRLAITFLQNYPNVRNPSTSNFLFPVPPSPKRGPQVVEPGATNFVVKLNADDYSGDGPIVEKTLTYRPVDGLWAGGYVVATLC